ncbi:MAG: NAD+ synthase [Rhodocyclaceae bacterium]|jgi:NAD+ synthase/NAD+ synthase (glutamine-hydrolysing)|nr:NAD+ synthase [Rhodocyclaceae bacterium]
MKKSVTRFALAQLNLTVGDLEGNADRVIEALEQARAAGAEVLLTPELALSSYPPEDLLLRPDFHRACEAALARVVEKVQGIVLVIGHPFRRDGRCFNAASVVRDGQVMATYLKRSLPNYGVFDEKRYFDSGAQPCVFELNGLKIGVAVCEDLWEGEVLDWLRASGVDLVLSLNASPYHVDKQQTRLQVMRERVAALGLPLLYCNLVGGQDELVFDGASFALDADGTLAHQSPGFEACVDQVVFEGGRWQAGTPAGAPDSEAELYRALVTGVRDYVGKNGFPGALVGLSGGIDSALTLAVAVDALGAQRVRAVMLQSPYTAQMSLDDSRDMVRRLGVRYDEIPITPAMQVFDDMLAAQFAGLPVDATEENLQSRIRGTIMMALSNKTGAIVLTTGNKSEMATGYATLYGDMAGGFAVLRDVYKMQVFALARWRNRQGEVIPPNIISRPPSAELRPDQTDQDSLPPYPVLDAIIEAYMERDESPREMIARGLPADEVRRTVGMLKRNEYKRRQAPVGIRVSRRGFGRDWRYPITSRYRDEY